MVELLMCNSKLFSFVNLFIIVVLKISLYLKEAISSQLQYQCFSLESVLVLGFGCD